eukprot:6263802-Pyramimonas_sp.AAC.1
MVGSGEGPVTALLEAFDACLGAKHWRAASALHGAGGAENGVEWTRVARFCRLTPHPPTPHLGGLAGSLESGWGVV